MKAALLASALLVTAPYQCATEKNQRVVEDSAPQALWVLAERFAQEGNAEARKTTLRQLISEYPSSRYAQRARTELGVPDPAEPAASQAE